jgi:hypothetical protein
MPKSVRIRTKVGVDRQVNLNLEQDFEYIEILSLKLSQSEIYTRQCADYGVVAGRVSVNDGFGVPNAKVSIFIALSTADEANPIISAIYPYKTISDINEDGYKYNLLPYKPSYPGHSATGSFPDLEDVLTNPTAIEIYDKYYKFTVTTNDSGDFMIFGVPTGTFDIIMNVDISDIGPFSQSPQDLIRLGLATESQVNGTRFRVSENLGTLPQIISLNKSVTILPLWGDPDLCQISITRTDFDLTAEANLEIKPTAIFMGSLVSDSDELAQKRNCKPKNKSGYQCSLFAGPGQILAIRQTIRQDTQGRPLLEEYEFENNGKVIDENGTWLLDVPMNLDYVVTNEFGEQVFSTDEKKGIPTRARYRFKVSWNQSSSLSEPVKRASFLVPNIREYGWSSSNEDPITTLSFTSPSYIAARKSYAFSVDWDDYADVVNNPNDAEEIIQDAIDCKDKFYEMTYNKVYTVSQLITQFRKGTANPRYLSIKNITDDTCESTTNKFPTNDTQYRFDLLFILFVILSIFFSIILKFAVTVFHIICFLVSSIRNWKICLPLGIGCRQPFKESQFLIKIEQKFSNLNIPLFTYPDCELCSCQATGTGGATPGPQGSLVQQAPFTNNSVLADVISSYSYDVESEDDENDYTTVLSSTMAGYQDRNPVQTWNFRTPFIQAFNYTPSFDTSLRATLYYYSIGLPLHEKMTMMNFKGKFFGDGTLNSSSTANAPLNVSSNSGVHTVGGGTNQIKVAFDTQHNFTNYGLETQLGGGLQLSPNVQNRGFHYDNVMILFTEEKYNDGAILTFNDPYNKRDPNLSGITKNIYDTYSITGETLNVDSQVFVGHTNPYTGERLITKYNIVQTDGESDKYLRYPTDIEYFQVIKSMTYSEYKTILDNNYFAEEFNPIYFSSFYYRVFDNYQVVSQFNPIRDFYDAAGVTAPIPYDGIEAFRFYFAWQKAWDLYSDKSETFMTIMVRGVDPHSSRVKVKYGLGRLFNRKNHWAVQFEGDYKLNIPLQPNDGLDFGDLPTASPNSQIKAKNNAQRCVKHDGLGNTNNGIDTGYSQGRIFFKSFHFKPSAVQWTPFRTRSVYKYSSLSETDTSSSITPIRRQRIIGTNPPEYTITVNSSMFSSVGAYTYSESSTRGGGLRVGLDNYFTRNAAFGVETDFSNGASFKDSRYAVGESVEGGSIMLCGGGNLRLGPASSYNGFQLVGRLNSYYYSKIYIEPTQDTSCFLMQNNERIVLRTDRMPSSDLVQKFTQPDGTPLVEYTMMANGQFFITEVSDEGVLSGVGPGSSTPGFTVGSVDTPIPNSEDPESFGQVDKLLSSFSCGSLVPINCYQTIYPDSLTVANPSTCQYYTGTNERYFIEGSCYSLVHPPYLGSNLTKDLQLITEWTSRMNINFGACREVFAHTFTNNWVNGTLYAFPFKNQRFFTGVNANPPNQPYNKYCRDTIFLDPITFNFYYRSSPYKHSGSDFIGRDGFKNLLGNSIGNKKNLMFPTTIMDLGPRDEIQKYISQSGNWDGYIMNRLNPTTFSDISDILNLFILSRFASASFGALFATKGANILNFFSRNERFVDADYAQLIATNSQLGIAAFEPANYPEPPENSGYNSPLYFPAGVSDVKKITFGIFFTGDSQVRDYISPNRTIYDSSGQIGVDDACSFTYIPITTQSVPFYLWRIETNSTNPNIFGTPENDWYTANNNIFQYEYQKIDRLYPDSKTFQPQNINIINYHKGWIANYSPTVINPATGGLDYKPEPGLPDEYLTGAPFYFYFGITKGASAFDRFLTKWIDTDEIVE